MALTQALPPELLSQVFFSIYNDAEDDTKSLLGRTSYELLDTLLVCRRWNDIACQTPRFWTTVYVAHDPDASVRAQTYTNRAKHLDLNVVITSTSNNTSAENCEKAFKQIVREHSPRLRSVTLPFLTPSISEALLNTLPNLVSFASATVTDSDRHILTHSNNDYGKVTLDTPKLQTLALHHRVSFVGNNWPNLRSLDCSFDIGDEEWVWGVLGASQYRLESLVLCDVDDTLGTWEVHSDSLADGIIPCTSLPSLTSLEVVGLEKFDWSTLRFADMPALTSLQLGLACLPDFDQESFLPTFERLQDLSIIAPFEDDVNLHHLFQSTPNISSLTVIEMGNNDGADDDADGEADDDADDAADDNGDKGYIIDPLLLTSEMPSGGPLLCPNLKEITILGLPIYIAKLKELVDLRLPQLRKIRVDSVLWAEGSCSEEESKAEDQALLEWLNERVDLSGFSGWWDESPEPQSPG